MHPTLCDSRVSRGTGPLAGARSSPTPAPACSVRFRALIAAEWYHGVRIRRCDRLVGALFPRIRVGEFVIGEERVTGMQLEGWPEQVHGVLVYQLRDGQIAHVRLLM